MKFYLVLGEKVARATVSPPLYILKHMLQVQGYTPLRQLRFSFRDFSNWVRHVMNIATASWK